VKHVLFAVLLGAACAVAIACGGSKSAMRATPAAPAAMSPEPAGGMPGDQRSQIEQLDAKITADLGTLKLERPTTPPATSPEAMSAGGVAATADPTCKPPVTQTCSDSCKLADSICENAGRICGLAEDLGNDRWAKEKCSSGTASCEAARKRCCGCS